jgi:hypothetical protein
MLVCQDPANLLAPSIPKTAFSVMRYALQNLKVSISVCESIFDLEIF